MNTLDKLQALQEFETMDIKLHPNSYWIGYLNAFAATYLNDKGRHELERRLIEFDDTSYCCEARLEHGICTKCNEHSNNKWED